MFDVVLEFPKMKVAVATRDDRVVEIRFLPPSSSDVPPKNALAERAARQLERYRSDPDARFDLPVVIEGSPLQRAVWDAMCAIPRGRTRTYGDIARELGAQFSARLPAHFPVDARAIGQACGDNRLPIVIPCHRVVAADGIGGFGHATGGYLLEVKRWLLMHEAPAFELTP
jgi:methylated-DNA-[protein]-cysteine S-methyltransferase